MAAIVFAFLALFAVGGQAAVITIGGATSVNVYVSGLLNVINKPTVYGTYQSVGSSAGISAFIAGTYRVAYSDNPLDGTQNVQAGGTAKLTIPFTIATYSFFTKKVSGLKLTGSQVYRIYTSNTAISWASLKSGLSGSVIPVARSDGSGTTEVVGKWIKSKVTSWPTAATTQATWKGVSGISSRVLYYKGSDGIGSFLTSSAGINGLGYIQTGIGYKSYKLFPASILNPSGAYVNAVTGVDLSASVPRPEIACDQSWAGVSLLNRPGTQTYSIVSFGYSFAKKKYPSTTVGTAVRNFLAYTQGSSAQNLAGSYLFDPIPSDFRTFALNYIKKIV